MESGHVPKYLNAAVKENNMIVSTTNEAMTSISGKNGFGTDKAEFEVEINKADILDGSSLQLKGKIKVNGDINKRVYFNSNAYSLPEQMSIEINGQNVLLLNQDCDHVSKLDRTLHSSFTQYYNTDVMALAGQDLKTEQSFVLDLSKYGSALKYFIVTSPVLTMKVKIRFQQNLAKLFYVGETGAVTGSVTGYTIDDLRLTADFSNFKAEAKESQIKKYQSPTGIKMTTHSYIPQRAQLFPTTNHRIQGSFQYRNLVSAYYVPVLTTIGTDDKEGGISRTDIVSNVGFEGGALPKNMRVRMDGSNYVNQNGTAGVSNKMEHLTGALKAAFRTPEENNVGYHLCKGYKENRYQPTGVSFVRGNDNYKEITNSGVNGFYARGALITEFDTTANQTNRSLLTIGVVTTTVSIENGQVSVVQ